MFAASSVPIDVMAAQSQPATEAPQVEGTTTRHDFVAMKLAFNQRTLAGDYRRVGSRNPKWDAAAEEFLEGMARYFVRTGEQVWYTIEAPARSELLAQCDRLAEQGCDDPLVIYCHATLLMDRGGEPEQYKAAAQKAIDAYERLRESDYNAWRKASAARRVRNIATAQGSPWSGAEIAERAQKDLFEFEVACFTTDAFNPEEGRLLLELIWRPMRTSSAKAGDLKVFVDAIAQTETQTWAALIVRGDYHTEAAWDARGGDWAANVGELQWEGFRRELATAGPLYVQAHRQHPDRPEAAAALITVSMGGHPPPGTNERFWFGHSVRAQLDYDPAWEAYRWSLFPRWGGSHEQMLALGRFALSTERFDTDVPTRMVSQLHQIVYDTGSWQAVRDLGPGVWKDLERMYAGYIKPLVERQRWNASHFAAERLARAWALHEWEAGAALLREGAEEPGVDSTPFRTHEFARVGITADEAIAEMRARASEHAAAISRAEALDKAGRRERADAAWQELLAQIPEDNAARGFVDSWLRQRELLRRVQDAPAGAWIDVPADPAYWQAVQGEWRFENGRIIAKVTRDRRAGDKRWGTAEAQPRLVLLAPLPDEYEVRATIGRLVNQEGKLCETGYCGLMPAWGAHESGGFYMNRFDGQVGIFRDGTWRGKTGFGMKDTDPECVVSVNAAGDASLHVDDKLRVQRAGGMTAAAGVSPRRLAIHSTGAHFGDQFEVYSVAIRRPAGPAISPRSR